MKKSKIKLLLLFIGLAAITGTTLSSCDDEDNDCTNCTSEIIESNALMPKETDEIVYLVIKNNKPMIDVLMNAFIPVYTWYYICNEDKISNSLIEEAKEKGSVKVEVKGNIRQVKTNEIPIHESEYDGNTYDLEIISIQKVTK